MAKRGPKPKDQSIVDGFNEKKVLSPRQRREINQQRKLLAEALKRKKEEQKDLKRRKAEKAEAEDAENQRRASSDDDARSAYEMLEDMRWVYRRMGGRKRLHEFISKNEKAFELMVKELMKIESAMKQASIKKNDDGAGSGNVFVVLKGLEEGPGVVTTIQAANGQGQIDMKSMAGVFQPDREVDEVSPVGDEDNEIRPERG